MSNVTANTKGIEAVSCTICGVDDAELHFEAPVQPHRVGIYARDVWPLVRCRRCGLIYLNPRVDDAARAAFYSFETPGDQRFVQDWFIENEDLQRPVWRRFLRVLKRVQPAGRLLDVGCGAGTFLDEARAAGFAVEGQEVAATFVDYCRRTHGLIVHDGFLDDLDLPRGSYDVITAFDVIEHHPDPRLLITQMRALLRPGGVVMISTHDIGNYFARHYGVRWRYIRPIGHITYFSRRTLARLLRSCGFEVVRQGGSHTIEASQPAEWRRRFVQFWRLIVLRALIIRIYKPLTGRFPRLARWRLRLGQAVLTHEMLLLRAGAQIAMDDDMVILARAVDRAA